MGSVSSKRVTFNLDIFRFLNMIAIFLTLVVTGWTISGDGNEYPHYNHRLYEI